jgi:HNH endonuclease
MTTYIPVPLRQIVVERAAGQCEYCYYPQDAGFLAFAIDHVIAEKHGGPTVSANLALACVFCNRFKGTDLGSLDPATGLLTPFFNPRTQRWADHFRIESGQIVPQTAAGRVTVAILRLNDPERIQERLLLIQSGWYAAPT